MDKHAPVPVPAPAPTLEERTKAKLADCIAIRDQARLQLNGIENQIYVLTQLLTPEPVPDQPTATPDGTI